MSITETVEKGRTGNWRLFGLSPAFLSFLVVGASASVVHFGAFFVTYGNDGNGLLSFLPRETDLLLVKPDLHVMIATSVAVEVAIAWKFLLYERWTFSDRPRRGRLPWRFLQLNAASLLGTVVTIATVSILTPVLDISPYLSTPIGVLIAFMLNWLFTNHYIWRKHSPAQPQTVP